jgi:hypothetical protein
MYCVPTATLNIMAFIANHGFPELMDPGPRNWQSDSIYNTVSVELFGMGNLMLTDPHDGTSGFGWRDGAKLYVDFRSNAFTVSHYFANNNYAPTQATITHTAICGGLVAFAYGRYSVVSEFAGIPLIDRTGGHVVTLQRSKHTSNERLLWVRDPADEQTDLFSQSTFGARTYDLLHDRIVATSPNFGALKVMTEIGVDAGAPGTSNRFIDEYIAIRPKIGYALTEESTVVTIIEGASFSGFPDPPMTSFSPGGTIEDVIINPDMNHFVAVTADEAGIASLVMIDAATGATTTLNEPLDLERPEHVIFGRNRALYLLDQRSLKCIDLDSDPVEVEAEVIPPVPLDALTYDDRRDLVVGVSASADALVNYDQGLIDPEIHPLPDGVDLGPDASLSFNPAEGTLLVHPGGGASVLYVATPLPGIEGYTFASISLPGVTNPSHVEADDSGLFYVLGEAGVQAYDRDDAGRYVPVEDALFSGARGETLFRVTHSRRNDAELPAEEYVNILPPELEQGGFVADCVWDLNGDGQVDAADLARLIGGWGTVGAFGDVDGDGVGPSDLAALIGAWGVCP